MFAILQCYLGQFKMGLRCRCYNHNIHRGILDHLLCRPEALDARVVFLGVIPGFGVPLDNSIELEFGDDCYQRDVEDFGRHAVADDRGVVLLRHVELGCELEGWSSNM